MSTFIAATFQTLLTLAACAAFHSAAGPLGWPLASLLVGAPMFGLFVGLAAGVRP